MMNYGVTQIAQLFPSLKRIKDKSLREKVAAVWNEAITTGCGGKGWSFDELRKVKFNEKNYFDHPGFGVIAIVSPAARS